MEEVEEEELSSEEEFISLSQTHNTTGSNLENSTLEVLLSGE